MDGGPLSLTARDRSRIDEVHALAEHRDVSALVRQLRTDRWPVRRAAIAALAELGEPAARALCDVLLGARDDEGQLAATVDALSATRTDPTALLEALASDPRPAVVCDAAAILGRRRTASSVPLLARLTRHEDDNVAVAAVEALGRIGGDAALDALVELVAGDAFFRVFPAIDVLGRTNDPRATAALARLLDNPLYAPEAARALGRTGDERAVSALLDLLGRSPDAIVRVAAVSLVEIHDRTYGRAGYANERPRLAAAPGVVARLLRALSSADEPEETAIARLLGLIGDDAAVAGLIDLVTAGHGHVVAAAEGALRDVGMITVQPLLDAILHGDSERRAILLPLVGARAPDTSAIIECLRDESPRVRSLAADTLARMGSTEAIPLLFQALRDPDARVAQAAVSALQSLGSAETARLAAEAARDPRPAVRRAGVRILAYFGDPSSLDALLDAARDPDERVREVALAGLPLIDDPRAHAALLEAALSEPPRTRGAAVRALGHVAETVDVLAPLLRALSDADAWVRYFACQALGRRRDERAVDALIARLQDDAGQVRVGAVEALAHLRNQRALQALVRAAEGDDPDMRRAAILGLGLSGRAHAFGIIARALRDADAATRLVAISALAALPGTEAVDAIASATRDPDPAVSSAAISVLGGRVEPAAFELLLPLLDEPASADRALLAMAQPLPGRVPAIVAAFGSASAERATMLAAALTRMKHPEANAALIGALTSTSVRTRRAAAGALALVPVSEHRSSIQHVLDREPDGEVRKLLRRALSH